MKLANNKLVKEVTKHGGELVKYISKNSPTILTGCAIAGAFAAVGLAIKATKPALRHIEEEKIEHRDRLIITDGDTRESYDLTQDEIDAIKLRPLEIVGAVWKDYVPTAIVLAGTTACIIGAHSISAKRTAAMAALYTASETALKDWKEKTEEVVGKGKKDKIKDAVHEAAVDRCPPSEGMFVETGHGQTHFMDYYSGRYFKSSFEHIRQAVNNINQGMIGGDWRASLNEFYYEIGLPGIGGGDDLGWTVDNMIELDPTSKLMSDGSSVTVINFKYAPDMCYRDT